MLQQQYGFYRVTRLRIKVQAPFVSGETSSSSIFEQTCATAFTTQYDETAAPGGFDSMAQWPNFSMGTYADPPRLVMSRRELLGQGQVKWWRCSSTVSEEDNLFYQGLMFFGNYADAAETIQYRIWLQLDGDIEFCQPYEYTDRLSVDRPIGTLKPGPAHRQVIEEHYTDDEKHPRDGNEVVPVTECHARENSGLGSAIQDPRKPPCLVVPDTVLINHRPPGLNSSKYAKVAH